MGNQANNMTDQELIKQFASFTQHIEEILTLNNKVITNKIEAVEEKVDTYNNHMTAMFNKDFEQIKNQQEKNEERHLEHYKNDEDRRTDIQELGKEGRIALREQAKDFDKKIDELKKCIDKHRDKTDEELHKINDRLIKEEVANSTKEKVDEVADRKKDISTGTIFGIIASVVAVISILVGVLN